MNSLMAGDLKLVHQPELEFLDIETQNTFRLCWTMVVDSGVAETFKIDEDKFFPLLFETQRLYDQRKNPFHNFAHGMTVMHQTYYLFKFTQLKSNYDSLGVFSMLIAALMHDVDHRGRTNVFEANSLSDIALTYNDKSILENHHCSTSFQLLRQTKYNITHTLSFSQFMDFRKIVIEAILSTDVKKHFEIINSFEKKVEDPSFTPNYYESPVDFYLLSGMVIHTCDLYVPTKGLSDSIRWSALVNKEFMEQNKEEVSRGLPEVSFYKNLDRIEVLAKSEKGFVEKIVAPLWQHLDVFLKGKLDSHRSNIQKSIEYWDATLKKHQAN